MQIDLNADLGEGFGPWSMGDDSAMLAIVTTANIACGLHAGDPAIMRRTVAAARERGVAVGAHPGYADLAGFGRRPLAGVTDREMETLVAYQAGALAGICALEGHSMTHVKTHGALGNACADDDALALAVARGIRAVDPGLAFIVMPGTATERAAERLGLRPIREVYADRTYADSFNLTPRSRPDAVLHDPQEALARVVAMVRERRILSTTGKALSVEIDSVCVHGDSPNAVAMAQALRDGLEAEGFAVRPCRSGVD
ncbi:LamB/YcsF family protein [Mangrovibrevibacter kandeliae]|uniref:LamB/YcsF family protein n=1 Tax=Mangrovibrevibacter kandeliae TaxID=2968473 RepID=UPI002119750D|nr:5-oxoprolinase subunit PxpA [Aurantimonas sp. CSK15Z-1]MCQ8781604.1 LamB/YcsF family protein [Aurantimonas sp. CSK15Z-1]